MGTESREQYSVLTGANNDPEMSSGEGEAVSDLRSGIAQMIEEYAITMAYPDTARPDVAGRYADAILEMVRYRLLAPENIERVTRAIYARHMATHGMTGPAYAFDTMTPKAKRSLIAERRELIQHAIDVALGGK